jgi:hypothetical protein
VYDVRLLILLIVTSALLGGAILTSRALAGRAEAQPVQSSQEPASGAAQPQSGSEEKEQESQPAKDYEDEMEDFIPSEKLPADSAISFPVDI